jgi:hypothetical protein
VRVILDEMLWPELATALNAFEQRHGVAFLHINDLAPGAQDEDIPEICREHNATALVSANVSDFGARRVLFEALLEAGVSVIVPRPSKRATLTPELQGAMLVRHLQRIASALRSSEGHLLLKLTEGGVVETSLEQLTREVG